MNKIFFSICIYISFCITACQMLADEVQKTKQPDSVSDTASTPPIMSHEKPAQTPPGLAQALKISQVRTLDPAVFTMIRPYTLDRSPVKLPQEQILD